jgi:Fe-S-cluster containining protein
MKSLPVVPGNERQDLCGPCGGKCCSIFPGIPHPEDLGAPDVETLRHNVRALVRSGRWVVAPDSRGRGWFEDDDYGDWYLRPALAGSEGEEVYDFENGPCTFLRAGRCDIYPLRPRGCREVVPTAPGNCPTPRSKIDQVGDWEPYEELLHSVRFAYEPTTPSEEERSRTGE